MVGLDELRRTHRTHHKKHKIDMLVTQNYCLEVSIINIICINLYVFLMHYIKYVKSLYQCIIGHSFVFCTNELIGYTSRIIDIHIMTIHINHTN